MKAQVFFILALLIGAYLLFILIVALSKQRQDWQQHNGQAQTSLWHKLVSHTNLLRLLLMLPTDDTAKQHTKK